MRERIGRDNLRGRHREGPSGRNRRAPNHHRARSNGHSPPRRSRPTLWHRCPRPSEPYPRGKPSTRGLSSGSRTASRAGAAERLRTYDEGVAAEQLRAWEVRAGRPRPGFASLKEAQGAAGSIGFGTKLIYLYIYKASSCLVYVPLQRQERGRGRVDTAIHLLKDWSTCRSSSEIARRCRASLHRRGTCSRCEAGSDEQTSLRAG